MEEQPWLHGWFLLHLQLIINYIQAMTVRFAVAELLPPPPPLFPGAENGAPEALLFCLRVQVFPIASRDTTAKIDALRRRRHERQYCVCKRTLRDMQLYWEAPR